VRKAVETLFDVKVRKVNIINMPAKRKRILGRPGLAAPWKKAVVTLLEGEAIDLA
jgi:large subunit ribosomal protein L23